ncbi:hypothetical protein SFRURICE_010515, partial [Spodoptera frugiperda]
TVDSGAADNVTGYPGSGSKREKERGGFSQRESDIPSRVTQGGKSHWIIFPPQKNGAILPYGCVGTALLKIVDVSLVFHARQEGKQPPRAANVAGPAANKAVGRSLPGVTWEVHPPRIKRLTLDCFILTILYNKKVNEK